jgi:hypothetical protein
MGEVIKDRIKWVPRFRVQATCQQTGETTQVQVQSAADALFVAETYIKNPTTPYCSVLDRRTGELFIHPEGYIPEQRFA